eukprot:gb/GEZN01025314.1/.p1 GENE.gb/GEZN01025314.1/~~gb/GEZN01025314.1/.p1  ORF type:complete len:110 (-),score=24.78 gb/GEZN01025314.1/:109-438(-)
MYLRIPFVRLEWARKKQRMKNNSMMQQTLVVRRSSKNHTTTTTTTTTTTSTCLAVSPSSRFTSCWTLRLCTAHSQFITRLESGCISPLVEEIGDRGKESWCFVSFVFFV